MFLLSLAHAAPLFVAGSRVAAGVAEDGSLCDSSMELCLLWDPPGEAPMGVDLLWPGYAYEVWSASWVSAAGATTLVNGAPYTRSDVSPTWEWVAGPDVDVLEGVELGDEADIVVRVEAPWEEDVVWVTVELTARVALSDVVLARMFDADTDYGWTGSYETVNEVGDAYVVASGQWDGRAVALGTPGGEGYTCAWCTTPAEAMAGGTAGGTGDTQLALVAPTFSLAAGETRVVQFAYAFGLDAAEAAARVGDAAANLDHDGDGVPAPSDCDDADAGVYPGAVETTDGRDEDCDGAIDEDSAGVDDDGDGYSEATGDCDDADAAVHPGAAPVDGVADSDCDGEPDDGTIGDGPAEGGPDGGDTGGVVVVHDGCATSGVGWTWWAGLAIVALRARRSR